MKTAVMSYSFNQWTRDGTVNVFGYLETCKYRYGLAAADLWNGTLSSLDEGYLARVKDALEEREMVLTNLAVDGAHIWEDDVDKRAANHSNALANLKAAEFLGAQTVRIDAGGARQDTAWTEKQFEEIVKRYQEYAQRAYDNGYRVGPENHWGPEDMPGNMVALCKAVDSPAFGVLLHAGRWRGDDAARGDEMVVPWTMHTHFSAHMSDSAIEQTMSHLRRAKYKGYYSVELSTTRYTEVATLLAKLRDIGEQWRHQD